MEILVLIILSISIIAILSYFGFFEDFYNKCHYHKYQTVKEIGVEVDCNSPLTGNKWTESGILKIEKCTGADCSHEKALLVLMDETREIELEYAKNLINKAGK